MIGLHESLVEKAFNNTNMLYKCKLCKRILDISKSRLSNLIRHLKRKHEREYVSLMEKTKMEVNDELILDNFYQQKL